MKMGTKIWAVQLRLAAAKRVAIAAICLAAWLSCWAIGGEAATLTVTNTNDSGAGSLRDAIGAAAFDGDTINFAPNVSGTILLTGGQLTITKNLAINGPGANVLAISGGMASRIFYVPPSDQLFISISGLKLTGGYSSDSGGAVLMDASAGPRTSELVLIECVITGNSSNALGGGLATFSFDELHLVRCTVADNYGRIGGGGLSVSGQQAYLGLEECTLSSNRGGYGGGIYDGGELVAYNSTFSGNTATIQGGGVAAAPTTNLTLRDCTLTGNTAPAGGGFYSETNLLMSSSILAGNTAASSPDGYGTVTMASSGYNLIGNTAGLIGLSATDQQNVNPLLGPLAANGGPTLTHALLPGSPAIDKGDPFTYPATDQRGLNRPVNGRTDVGAYEVDSSNCGTLVTNLNDNGPGSLRCAIASAFSGGTVTFASGLMGTITLTSGQLGLGKSLTINGPGPDKLTVNANNASRVFSIGGSGYTANLAGLKLTGGRVVQSEGGALYAIGGAYYSPSTLNLSNCAITGNAAVGGFGGGMAIYIGSVNLTDCTVSNNNAKTGAGLWSQSAQTTLANCTVSGNNAIDGGGGVAAGGTFRATNSTFSGNSTGGYGGGITSLYGSKTFELTNCTITGNRSDYAGGLNATTRLSNTLIFNNTVTTQYPDANAFFVSLGHNLIGNTAGSGGNFAASDVLNPNPAAVKLGPLADNGGKTRTHALLNGSIAIDAGDDAVTQAPLNLATDQRGEIRLYGGHVDIGAYESQAQAQGCSITINPPALPAGAAGVVYNQAINATPADAYAFTIVQGNLPSGITLNPTTGTLSGTPSVVGTYNFTIKSQNSGGCYAQQAYTLAINCPAIALSALPPPTLNTPYNQTVTAAPTGGNYSFAITAGALPAGLSLNPATGVVSGTTTVAGIFNFTITATGFGACTGYRAYSFTISGGACPTITLPALPNSAVGQMYGSSVAATPSGSYSYTLTGTLPPGVSFYNSAGLLFGYPAVAGTYNFTITATDANNCTASRSYSLTVAP